MTFKPYHPPHIYFDKTFYFITSRTYNKLEFFKSDRAKQIFTTILNTTIKNYNIKLYAWVLLYNHYHLLFYLNNKNHLIKFIKSLHGKTTIELNKFNGASGRKIWYQYWDRCIRSEADFYKHFNYIHQNPIKHNFIKDLRELEDYKFSSYPEWLRKKNREWLLSVFERYPIKDFVEKSDV